MRFALKKIYKNKFIKNIIVIASGTVGAQLVTFALVPVITRIYGPEEYGTLGTFISIITVLGPIASLSYPIALVLPKDSGEAYQISKLSIIVCLFFGVFLTILLCFFQKPIIEIFQMQLIGGFLYLLPLVILFSGFQQVVSQWLIRTQQFKVTAQTAITHSIIINSSKIGVGLVFPFAASLIFLQTFGIALRGILMLLIAQKPKITGNAYSNSLKVREIAKKYRDFPLYRTPQVLFNSLSRALPIILLASYFGPSAAGFYSLGRQSLDMPVQLIGKSFQDVFYPKVSQAVNNGKLVSNMIMKSTFGLIIIGVVPFGIIVIFGKEIFSFVFGESWYEAGIYGQWIAILSFFMLITKPAIVAIPTLKIQREFLIIEVLGTVFRIAGLLFGLSYFDNDVFAVALFVIASIIVYILIVMYTLYTAFGFDKLIDSK